MVKAYYKILTGTDSVRQMKAAKAWSMWEGRTATLLPDASTEKNFSQPQVALSMARIECHYFSHDSFLTSNQLLENASRLASIPGVIVHGRYDVICPMDGALALHSAWSASKLMIVPDAGHAATEPGITDALVTATDEFALTY